jgi:mono/diheme cytochrome c family protein
MPRSLPRPRPGGPVGSLAAAMFGAVALLGALAPANAQEVERGKQVFSTKAGCPHCHGWAGDGRGDPRSEGGAPNLRLSHLDKDQVMEVVKCGRPGTGMPYHDRFAYTDKRCYGLTKEEVGALMPKRGDQTLQRDEIEALADYVTIKVIGKTPDPTLEECIEYFGTEINECKLIASKGG